MHHTYRQYRYQVIKTSGLHALIRPPQGSLSLSEIPRATREEGEAVLEERIKAVIDADIEKTGRG